MINKNDGRAEAAFKWMFVPLAAVALGFVATNMAHGLSSIACFFAFLCIAAVTSIPPAILGVLALKGGTTHKEKALLAVMAPLMILFIYFVSFGGLARSPAI